MAKPLVVEIVADASKYAKGLKDAEKQTGRFSKAAGVAGAAIVGGLVVGMKKSVDAAMDAQKVQAQTEAQLKTLGISYKDHAGQIENVIQKTSKLAAIDDEDLQTSFNQLVRTTGNVNQALTDSALAADIARGKNISLEAATSLVTKAELGKAGALTRAGIAADKNATSVELLDTLHKKFAGSAEAYGKTAAGSQERFQIALENVEESMGKGLLPVLSKVMNTVAVFTDYLSRHTTITKILVGVLGSFAAVLITASAAARIMTASQIAMNLAMSLNPIGVVIIALVAFGAALVVAWQKSETFRRIVTATWDAIKTGAQAVLTFFRSNWPVIATLISGPFAPLVALATDAFGIRSHLFAAFNAIKAFTRDAMLDVAGFWKELPGRIGSAIANSMHVLKSALESLFSAKKIVGWIEHALGFSEHSELFGNIGMKIVRSMATGALGAANLLQDAVVNLAKDAFGSLGGTQGGGTSGKGGVGVGKSGGSTLDTLVGWAHQEGIAVTSTNTGNHVAGSYHYQNRAIDVSGSAGKMAGFFMDTIRRFGVGNITELFYDPMGYYVDNGRAVKGAIGGHSDHVHFALGSGGIVTSPTVALIGERGPEAVIPLNRGMAGMVVNVNMPHYLGNVRDAARQIRDELTRMGIRNGISSSNGYA